ncbi:MAG: hypothetical protein A2806_01040 [Candidatus Terrybacteria bacterium RIFCSPHIGHO2_01_FULL_48_17]|uniref:Putative gamma-glutamylcyclotransferase n=1 Tax=Candidatus Terrybacteria bacterium RIFCSPHIGHO2_01_FULL_48_17 TaxID=1802362 RepID=A0A1G2PK87_9BACT|nr:MAG: hypothetical protein A2806_01040 [Candidatus Terrybacteria bacterium RIFCSPHIGHO2_01_FULL_48_17]OHA51900.1 MAG: hypothetical protein A3A30_01055 [Candidatus Terrybacteria bacterium RIFCSPLOWO2_01_FULL_48_14]
MRLFILYDISLLFKTLTFEHIYAILKSGSSKEKEDDMNLFVYGTLTKPRVQQKVLGHTAQSQPAILKNHTFIRTPANFGNYLMAVRSMGNRVHGLLLSGLSKEDFEKLDEYEEIDQEGCPYHRKDLLVVLENGATVWAAVYVGGAKPRSRPKHSPFDIGL